MFQEFNGCLKLVSCIEEGQELRGLIRAFIEQEKLAIRVTRSTTNSDLLDQIEHALEGKESSDEPEDSQKHEEQEDTPAEPETTGRSRRRRE